MMRGLEAVRKDAHADSQSAQDRLTVASARDPRPARCDVTHSSSRSCWQ